MRGLGPLLRPQSVVVIGASADTAKVTGRPVTYLQKHGYAGRIYPINPHSTQIAGLRCYSDVASLPEVPDVAIVLLGAARVPSVVVELAARGVAAAIVVAGGFGEIGADGAQLQADLKAAAGSMRLLGPNTIGLVNRTDNIMLSASGALELAALPAGAISVVSQSGGILGALLSRAAGRGLGLAKLVATGNEADIDCTEMLAHLLDDTETRVVALYLEGLRRPAVFRTVAMRARALGKAIVAYKVGRSEAGARSASSHTGALAGPDRLYDALFRQCGVIRATTFADLLDIPAALATGRRGRGRRVAVLTSTGGAGTLLADTCGAAGFTLPQPDEATLRSLAALPGGGMLTPANPLDVTLAGLQPELLRGAVQVLLASRQYDAVIGVAGCSALANPTPILDAMRAGRQATEKPLLAYVSPHAPQVLQTLNDSGIPAFEAPESIAASLNALQYVAPSVSECETQIAPMVVDIAGGTLNEAESKALFAQFGIPVVAEHAVPDAVAAAAVAHQFGDNPVVLKILSRQITHKSEFGAVRVGLTSEAVPAACAEMLERLHRAGAPKPEGFLIQEMVRDGMEMILGFHRDPQLGPALLLGTGGVLAELLGDTVLRLLPIAAVDAEQMLAELRSARLLAGFRGAVRRDIPALLDAVMAFTRMAAALGERLVEAEINPLMVLPEGQGVRAIDGLVVLH